MTNLCCLSAYSFGKSCIDIDAYVERAKELGYDSIGLCDENVTYGFPQFFDACKKHSIKPVAGMTILIGDETINAQAIVYALNEQGYSFLCSLLAKHKQIYSLDDLTIESDCFALVLNTKDGNLELIKEIALTLSSKIKHLYLGITIENDDDLDNAKKIRSFAKDHSYELVALPKVLYLQEDGQFIINIIKSSKENRKMNDDELAYENIKGKNYLHPMDEIKSIYSKEEIDNADLIASKSNFDLFNKQRGGLFSFSGNEKDDLSLFNQKTKKALEEYSLLNNEEYVERLKYETSVISKMNFISYFLIVSDYVSYARSVGIKVGPGRGSAAGSLVSYLLGITQIDPIKFGLSFERFLNPYRVTMPDIDIDFQDDRREEIVDYLTRKYTAGRVAKIITFGTYKARSAVRASGVALGIPSSRLSLLTKAIPQTCNDLKEAYKESSKLKELCKDPYFLRIMKYANRIEGLPNNPSIHAAGVILAGDDIYETVPLSEGTSGIACYEYAYLERMGFLKVDLLSLHFLTVISRMEDTLKKMGRQIPDYLSLRDDKKTYETMNSLDLTLIFQLDGNYGMRKAIEQIHPTCFDDLVALLALYRPGPMDNIPKFAKNKKDGAIPSSGYQKVDDILKDTYGILVYQEQILRLAHDIAGMDMGEADLLRRAISKKHLDDMERYKDKFINGCQNNGLFQKDAQSIYELILKFANYGFNKSHSVCYALITFQLAYLKTYEPTAFYGEVCKEISPGNEKFRTVSRELYHRGITIMPVNANISNADETFIGDKCCLGLSRVKSLSDDMIERIVKARQERPFENLGDFLLRGLDSSKIDSRNLSSLIDTGLFDCFSYNRVTLKENILSLMQFVESAIDSSQFPVIKNLDMDDLEKTKAFIRELDFIGVSLTYSLKALAKDSYRKGYSIGVATEDFQPTHNGGIMTLANEYSKIPFIVNEHLKVQTYDIVIFKARKGYREDKWFADDIKVVKIKESKE